MLIGTFCIIASARDNTDYTYVLEFENNKNAYPIMNSKENAVGLFEYYKGDFSLFRAVDGEYGTINVDGAKKDSLVLRFNMYGDYPMFEIGVIDVASYTDFCILYLNSTFYLYGWKDGSIEEIYNLDEAIADTDFDYYVSSSLSDGYIVNLPNETIIPDKDEMEKGDMIDVLLVVLSSFIVGIGATFSEAFSSMFLVNGVLNSLAIFLLVMGAVFMAIGLIFVIIKTFSKKGE